MIAGELVDGEARFAQFVEDLHGALNGKTNLIRLRPIGSGEPLGARQSETLFYR